MSISISVVNASGTAIFSGPVSVTHPIKDSLTPKVAEALSHADYVAILVLHGGVALDCEESLEQAGVADGATLTFVLHAPVPEVLAAIRQVLGMEPLWGCEYRGRAWSCVAEDCTQWVPVHFGVEEMGEEAAASFAEALEKPHRTGAGALPSDLRTCLKVLLEAKKVLSVHPQLDMNAGFSMPGAAGEHSRLRLQDGLFYLSLHREPQSATVTVTFVDLTGELSEVFGGVAGEGRGAVWSASFDLSGQEDEDTAHALPDLSYSWWHRLCVSTREHVYGFQHGIYEDAATFRRFLICKEPERQARSVQAYIETFAQHAASARAGGDADGMRGQSGKDGGKGKGKGQGQGQGQGKGVGKDAGKTDA